MTTARRYLTIAFCFVLAAATFTIVAPKAVHAITAALVQVVNTSANPVPTAESPLRYQAALCTTLGSVGPAAINNCTGNGGANFTVPVTASTGATVRRLIVDNVSGFCSTFDNPGLLMKAVRLRGGLQPDSSSGGVTSFTHYVSMSDPPYSYVNTAAAPSPYTNHQETDTTFGQTTNFSFSAGETVGFEPVTFYTGTPSTTDYYCIARVEGYLVTQ